MEDFHLASCVSQFPPGPCLISMITKLMKVHTIHRYWRCVEPSDQLFWETLGPFGCSVLPCRGFVVPIPTRVVQPAPGLPLQVGLGWLYVFAIDEFHKVVCSISFGAQTLLGRSHRMPNNRGCPLQVPCLSVAPTARHGGSMPLLAGVIGLVQEGWAEMGCFWVNLRGQKTKID